MIFVGIGMAAYLIAMIATIPARLFVPIPDATGTVWRGQAPLLGGQRVEWRWAPLRSLTGLGFAADFSVIGSDTTLAGRALLRPGRALLDNISGTADAALIEAFARPSFSCAIRMQVDIKEIAIGAGTRRAHGRIQSDAGMCQAYGGSAPVAVPAMTLLATQTPGVAMISIARRGQRRTPYLVGGFEESGRLRLVVTAEGAAALPFASPPGGMKMETNL